MIGFQCNFDRFSRAPFITAALSVLMCANAQAVTPETAARVWAQVMTMPLPADSASEFQHWTFNTAQITASTCGRSAHAIPPGRLRLTRGGAYAFPSDDELEKVCASIAAEGIHPVCTGMTIWVEGVKERPGYPSFYLQVAGNLHKLPIGGTLTCYLTPSQIAKQSFVPKSWSYEWSQMPHPQQINLSSGPAMLNMGNLLIKVPSAPGMNGKGYVEPRMALKID